MPRCRKVGPCVSIGKVCAPTEVSCQYIIKVVSKQAVCCCIRYSGAMLTAIK
jgi:hypothetical protein